MELYLLISIVLATLCSVTSGARRASLLQTASVSFTVYSYTSIEGKSSPIGDESWRNLCLPNGTLVMIAHGFEETMEGTPWIRKMIHNFLELYGGCVFFMDYSKFSSTNYFDLLFNFDGLSAVLRDKLLTLDDPQNIQMFGFSFGARIVIEAAIDVSLRGKKIDKIFACDPARPGFDFYLKNPQIAARFVQCINTSIDKGTQVYNCHQNWRLGNCGNSQIGAQGPPMGSHGLCPYIFNESFHSDILASNLNNCSSWRPAKDVPPDYKMGPNETRTSYIGDIFAVTAENASWNVNVIHH